MRRVRRTWVMAFVLAAGWLPRTVAAQAPEVPSLAERERAEALRRQADDAYRAGRFADAAALYGEVAALPYARSRGVAHYQAACASALLGDAGQAFRYLDRAMDEGFRYSAHLVSDPDLAGLHDDQRWPRTVARAEENLRQYRRSHADPGVALLVTEDVGRFGAALERAHQAADSAGAIDAIVQHYLEPGSAGLIDFYFSRMQDAPTLTETAVRRYPEYYRGLSALQDSIAARSPQIRAAFRRLAELHPEAHFPPVYFVVGHLRSGGTVSENGLIVGLEVFGVTAGAVTDEFPPAAVPVIHSFDRIPFVVSHELVHLQQQARGEATLLGAALREGGADLIAELMTGARPDEHHYAWGEAHEQVVWNRFVREMHGADTSAWIANNHVATPEWPAALGYFVGYRIAQAYYDRAHDKQHALRQLLLLDDPLAILAESGYMQRFE